MKRVVTTVKGRTESELGLMCSHQSLFTRSGKNLQNEPALSCSSGEATLGPGWHWPT